MTAMERSIVEHVTGSGNESALKSVLLPIFPKLFNTKSHCPAELAEAAGDQRIELTGRHELADQMRQAASSPTFKTRLLRWIDDWVETISQWLDGPRER